MKSYVQYSLRNMCHRILPPSNQDQIMCRRNVPPPLNSILSVASMIGVLLLIQQASKIMTQKLRVPSTMQGCSVYSTYIHKVTPMQTVSCEGLPGKSHTAMEDPRVPELLLREGGIDILCHQKDFANLNIHNPSPLFIHDKLHSTLRS